MTIETKYNIKDEIWIMYGNKPCTGRIIYIEASTSEVSNAKVSTKYGIGELPGTSEVYEHEYNLYPSKEELIASL